MKVVEYLQQPSSIYALMALLFNTRAETLFHMKDLVEWFKAEGVDVNVQELKRRWKQLEQSGFAETSPALKWKARAGHDVGFILTEKGDKAAEALMDIVNYIKEL